MTSNALVQRAQTEADHNDLLNAIAAWIHEARQAGMKYRVFPKYLYINTRVWEDEVAPGNAALLETMQIEVRHSPLMPIDRFSFTADPYPVHEVAAQLRQYDALPTQA